mmetsp:Transcript_10271/g.24682  ORF Transcript_10271/g.24682 Transcript_10271/m.24682 type:complete len:214 (-) Transcript_10271:458-1099(-)
MLDNTMHLLQIFDALDDLLEHLFQTCVALVTPHWRKLDVCSIKHCLLALRQATGVHCPREELLDCHGENTHLAFFKLFLLESSIEPRLQLLALSEVLLECNLALVQLAADGKVLVLQLRLHTSAFVANTVQPCRLFIICLCQLLAATLQRRMPVHEDLYVISELFLALVDHVLKEIPVLCHLSDLPLLCVPLLFLLQELLLQSADFPVEATTL